MTSVITSVDSRSAYIAGYGIIVSNEFELAPGVTIRPNPEHFDPKIVADGCKTVGEYATVLGMMEFASFYLAIRDEAAERDLAVKAWNSLWLFPLLALACQSPCTSLYSWACSQQEMHFAIATPHGAHRAMAQPIVASGDQLQWARENMVKFEALQKDVTFTTSLRSYINSHHLFGYSSRIMQLWSGIECLFKVSSEITRACFKNAS
jgi:hypothetical protein